MCMGQGTVGVVRGSGGACQGGGLMGRGSCGGLRHSPIQWPEEEAGMQKQVQEVEEEQEEAGVAGAGRVPRGSQRETVTGQNHFKN